MLKVAANGQRLFLPGAVAQDVVFEGAPFAKFARPSDLKEALVLGFASDNATNLSDIKLGKVSCTRWMACARKKLWWMIPEWGTNMSDVPTETQFMLLEHGSGGPYTVLLPLIDGPFRATLKADRNKDLRTQSEDLVLRICSGDEAVTGKQWDSALLIVSGTSVFQVIEKGVTLAARLSGTARPRTEKQLPPSVDYFGWCTWDAFYSQVSAEGIREGLDSLRRGGITPRTLIIDDGWQMTEVDDEFSEAVTTKALRRMQFPATETIDEEFDEAERSVLASYAKNIPGGTEMMNTMPALNDQEYGELVRAAMRARDSLDSENDEPSPRQMEFLQKLDDFKKKNEMQVPEIERTILRLAKKPQERALWSRLVQRIAGYLLGVLQVFFLIFYQWIVDPAKPNSWAIGFFEWLTVGPLKENMLVFFKVSGDFTKRIITVKANGKFSSTGATGDQRHWFAEASDFKSLTDELRKLYGLNYIYCWHGLPAYWGGIMPSSSEFADLKPRIVYARPTESLKEIEPAMRWNPAVLAGIGVVEDSAGLYQRMHNYLVNSGIDGVKVDCQAGVGLVGSVIGGGPALARKYHDALETSIAMHFPGNHAINCMSHSTENIYQMRDTAIARASDDFYPKEKSSSSPHIAACAFNSIFLGALCQPDWDMFQSQHPAAHLHACARAVSGGAVYVSDKVNRHDYGVLRKLVLRDGSILRCLRPGVPSADCIFRDPLRDGQTLMKVWNENMYSGVVGVFHLQGSFWCRTKRRFVTTQSSPPPLTTSVAPRDVETLSSVEARLDHEPSGSYAVLTHSDAKLRVVQDRTDGIDMRVSSASANIATIAPVLANRHAKFAPLGLSNMLNSGGAVREWRTSPSLSRQNGNSNGAGGAWRHELMVAGEGTFVAYCSVEPTSVHVDGQPATESSWTREDGKLVVQIQADSELGPSANVQHTLAVAF